MARKVKAYNLSEEMFLQKLGIDYNQESTVDVTYNIHNGIVLVHTTEHYGTEIMEGDTATVMMDMNGYWQERIN